MAKRYKCPYCELRDERKKLIAHIDKRHEEMLPEGYDGARTVYDMINHTNGHGTCRICKKDTQWNMSSQRYDVLCGNPKCKEAMREEYKKNMIRVKGTYNILNDPEQQQKMLANRKISGKYRYSDGTVFTYTGSYEKKLLEFEDAVMNIPSKDIMMPGPTIEYMYNGKKHFYIADQLYIPYNLIIEIKDGGDNKNGKETPGMIASREKTIEKEKVITDKGEYNYLRLTNNDFVQLIEIFMELKENYMSGNDSKVVRIHEGTKSVIDSNYKPKGKEYNKGQLMSVNTESDSILEEYTYCNGKKMKKVSKSAKLYHGSRIQNLKEITPHNDSISRIGNVSAVYATKDKRFAACYGTLWNDDIAKQGSWDDWNTVVMGISDKVDMDSPCSLYELENDGSFFEISSKEVASLNTIKVIKEHKYSSYREMLKKNGVKTISYDNYKNNIENPNPVFDYLDESAILEDNIFMESMKNNNNKLYFLSTINMNDDRLTPRIPSNYFTKNNYEENKTPRVCFAKTIDGCLMGLSKNLTDKEFYVHVPDPDGYYNVYNPTIKEVPDCKITGEVWIKKPVDLKCIGKIKVLKDTGEAGIPFKYGDKTAELYKWDWKWVDKYDDESINESLETRLTTNIFEKEITIYHGSPTKTSIIYPLSFNAGTKLSKPRMSSFWADEHTAKLFGIYRLIQNNDFIISFTPDLNGLLVKPSDYNNIIKLLKSENIYLYEKTLDKKYVGIGHSNYFDEYTVDYPVRPDKIYVLGYNDLKAEISSIDTYNTNDNEKIYKITEKNLNIMLKMNNGIMRKIIANDFQYFRDKSKEYRKGQLATANNESAIDPKVVEIANYINENFIFNEDYFNVKMEPINNNTYLIAEYIIGKNSLDMKKLSDSFSILKERCNTDQYGLCMIKESNNNKYNLYLTDISAFKESVLKGPKKCPKCGGKVGVFIQGEPIYKCIECGKFLGVVSCHLGKKKK